MNTELRLPKKCEHGRRKYRCKDCGGSVHMENERVIAKTVVDHRSVHMEDKNNNAETVMDQVYVHMEE